jgi:predicted Fe-S protein YdhL (DUF1289 family)
MAHRVGFDQGEFARLPVQSSIEMNYTPIPNPEVPSPCVGVCRLDEAGRLCVGCGRSTAEIGEWPYATRTRKLQIRQESEARMAIIHKLSRGSGSI